MSRDSSPLRVADLISESVLVINDGYRAKNDELASAGLPFARAGNIDGGFQFTDADYFPEQNLARVGNKISRPGDVVFTSKGTVGRFAYVADSTPRFVYSPQLCFWRALDRERLHSRWLFYWMQCGEFQEQCDGVKGQTDMADYVSLRDQRAMFISLPPVEEQRAIGLLLGALDDKIELNRRMNQTLESMARAIFRSWFVDFDPVVAKAEGRQPLGMSADVAELFPSEFRESELGAIPKGWTVESIGERASKIQYGYTQSASKLPVGPKFLRITDIQGGRVDWGAVPYCECSEKDFETYRICAGDILVARTGASTGENIYIADAPVAVFASYLVRVQFANRGVARVVGQFMRSEEYFNYIESSIGGSAQPNAGAPVLTGARLAYPPAGTAEAFQRLVEPFDLRRLRNMAESVTLAALRDTLLPKLMSGELRIRDAEKLVGTHV